MEEPANFLDEKSKEYEKSTIHWSVATLALSVLLMMLLGLILTPEITINETVFSITLFSKDMPVYSSVILLSMVCLIIYVLRVFIKMIISSKHLSEEYKQKYVLTYFYLSLLNVGKIDEKISTMILSNLFSKADTGLIQSDGNTDFEGLLATLISYKN
ncbi:DUF6161 domain-containing protein [Tannockella kyphosi]|uniref:DUF6161 domain-containing protein n=1 Tax=Tannockella kyphosi TaxID=2899121 RepID=UPI0020138827|nr:DUF6161 domain-containing protein [Tannockella kyphosi]